MTTFIINGSKVEVDKDPQSSLLWLLREHLQLTGTKYGCGAGLCGACTVHVDGEAFFSCITSLESVAGKSITTIEGLDEATARPLQKAWIDQQVPQCGYCQSGQIMKAATLIARNNKPSRQEIVQHMNTNLCRCGTYSRIISAIEQAAGNL